MLDIKIADELRRYRALGLAVNNIIIRLRAGKMPEDWHILDLCRAAIRVVDDGRFDAEQVRVMEERCCDERGYYVKHSASESVWCLDGEGNPIHIKSMAIHPDFDPEWDK